MSNLSKLFPTKKIKLHDEFPLPLQSKLKDQYPYYPKKGGIGSGFLNNNNIITASPVYPDINVSFDVTYQTIVIPPSGNTVLIYQREGTDSGITLTNTTDDMTYTTLAWEIPNQTVSAFQTKTITPNYVTLTQSWEVTLRASTVNKQAVTTKTIIYIPYPKFQFSYKNIIRNVTASPIAPDLDDLNPMSINVDTRISDINADFTEFDADEMILVIREFNLQSTRDYTRVINKNDVSSTVLDYNLVVPSQDSVILISFTYKKNSVTVGIPYYLQLYRTYYLPIASINSQSGNFIQTQTVDQGLGYAYNFTDTSSGGRTNRRWSATGITLSGTNAITVSGTINAGIGQPPVIVTLEILSRPEYLPVVVLATSTYRINYNVIPTFVASFNNNTSNFTTTETATLFTNAQITLNNTSVGLYDSYSWSKISGNSSIIVPSTGSPATFNIYINKTSAPVQFTPTVVRLTLIKSGVVIGKIDRTIRINVNGASKLQDHTAGLLNLQPVPQALATEYEGIEFLIVPSVPATEPTKWRIRSTNRTNQLDSQGRIVGSPNYTANIHVFQGTSVPGLSITNSSRLILSSDLSLTNSGTGVALTTWQAGNLLSDTMSYTDNWAGNFIGTIAAISYPGLTSNQAVNSVSNFDGLSITVPVSATKQYITAFETYFSNNLGLSTSGIKGNTNYFGPSTGRFRLINENNAMVTFQLPPGNYYSALITGALLVNNNPTPIWGTPSGSGYGSLYNITPFIGSNGRITFGKVQTTGQAGSVYGFFIFNNIVTP